MEPSFLEPEKNGIGAIVCAEAAIGKTAPRTTGWFGIERNAELQRFFAAFFENAQDVPGLAEGEAREWFEKFENTAQTSFFRSRFVGIAQFN